jgi:hypothetical protein
MAYEVSDLVVSVRSKLTLHEFFPESVLPEARYQWRRTYAAGSSRRVAGQCSTKQRDESIWRHSRLTCNHISDARNCFDIVDQLALGEIPLCDGERDD